jgi:hypothetical protein
MTPSHAQMNMVASTPYTPGDPFASPGFAMAYSAQRQQMYMMTPVPGQHTAAPQRAPVTPLHFNHPDLSGCPQPVSVVSPGAMDDAHLAPATPGASARAQHVLSRISRVTTLCCLSQLTTSRLPFVLPPDSTPCCLCLLGCLALLQTLLARGPSSEEISPAGLTSPSPPAKEQQEKEAAMQTPKHQPPTTPQHSAHVELQCDTQRVGREPLKQASGANVVSGRVSELICRAW